MDSIIVKTTGKVKVLKQKSLMIKSIDRPFLIIMLVLLILDGLHGQPKLKIVILINQIQRGIHCCS